MYNHFVDWGMFWKNIQGRKEKIFCGSLYDLEQRIMADMKIRSTEYVIFSNGINDIDSGNGAVAKTQLETVKNLIDRKYG